MSVYQEGQFLKKDPETPLHGEDSNIDSLGLIIFMVNLEQKLFFCSQTF